MTGRILIVDDVATNRIVMKVKLGTACYSVDQATGGAEALRMALAAPPDLILLDIVMPDLDGLEVCRRLKANPRTSGIPVVLVTAHTDRETRMAGLKAGADDILAKPVVRRHAPGSGSLPAQNSKRTARVGRARLSGRNAWICGCRKPV